jgi:hypothetical protein
MNAAALARLRQLEALVAPRGDQSDVEAERRALLAEINRYADAVAEAGDPVELARFEAAVADATRRALAGEPGR